jgi:hypothetical protein
MLTIPFQCCRMADEFGDSECAAIAKADALNVCPRHRFVELTEICCAALATSPGFA